MRFISLLVAFCFSLNVMAGTGTVAALEKTLDNYHYALSVEWDQKDQKFYDAKTAEFFAELEILIKEQGLSKEEILSVIEKKTNNDQIVNALKLKLSLMGQGASLEDLSQMVKEASKDLYSQGASWNGSVVFPIAIGLLVAGVIGYALWWDANHKCVAYEEQYVCNTYSNCTYGGGYYDPYYGGGFGGSYCYGSYTTCGYTDVCTQYERK